MENFSERCGSPTADLSFIPNVPWLLPNNRFLPMGGKHVGKATALRVLRQSAGAWDEFRLSASQFFEDGQTVVALGHSDLRKAGLSATTPWVHVWRWEDEQITRFQVVTDTLQLAQLLGMA
jgi:ketosteroid isomerase-like protein